MHAKLQDLRTGKERERRFRAEETVEDVQPDKQSLQFLYADDGVATFMNPQTYEQFAIDGARLGKAAAWLTEETVVPVEFVDGEPLGIVFPEVAEGRVAQTADPYHTPGTDNGPGLQWIRGFVFALVLYPFRQVFLEGEGGWLKLWGLVAGIGILSTYGPAPGSVEGFLYTTIPPFDQVGGLSEVVGQSLAFSILLVAWYRRPHKAWGIVLYTLAVLGMLMSLAGVLAAR